ncbi:MAG: hypothetical protein KAH44_32465, partial [Oricola sp.]|nr:hypothetical protein [Oricola sp.]
QLARPASARPGGGFETASRSAGEIGCCEHHHLSHGHDARLSRVPPVPRHLVFHAFQRVRKKTYQMIRANAMKKFKA